LGQEALRKLDFMIFNNNKKMIIILHNVEGFPSGMRKVYKMPTKESKERLNLI